MRVPKAGDLIQAIGIPTLAGVELKIRATLLGTVFARPKRGRHDIELEDGQFTYLEPEKVTAAEKSEIIKRLVKKEYLNDVPSFRMQQGFFNQLFEKYPDKDFWINFQLGFQLRSLIWLKGAGSDQLRIKYNQFCLDKGQATCDTKQITLREEKIGQDIQITNKPKTLLDIF